MPPQEPFKVLIVGAGVTGLTLAHCLVKANIDFVLLDKGVVAPAFGNTITLFPHGIRILHQLDCLNAVMDLCAPMGGSYCRGTDGRVFAACGNYFGVMKTLSGYDARTIGRQEFLQLMYDRLPDSSKVLEGARVEDIIAEGSTVRLILTDGREFTGDLVVGADGVHSKVRELMWDMANKAVPGMVPLEEKQSIKTAYSAMIGLSTPVPGLERFQAVENTSHDTLSFLIICQPQWVSWQVFRKLPEHQKSCWPDRKKFTEEDMQALSDKIADYPVTEKVKFGELWKRRTRAQMISLEEGVLDHWFFGRIVMAGDALHKATPNSGLGGSTAMEDAASIANAIHKLSVTHPNRKPTDDEIHDELQDYQTTRIRRVKKIVEVAGEVTRKQAYDGWVNYFSYRWLLPFIGMECIAHKTAKLCAGAPKLTYVQFGEEKGLLDWRDMRLGGRRPESPGESMQRVIRHSTHCIMSLSLVLGAALAWYLAVENMNGNQASMLEGTV
ncbi:hypothetical protein ACKAV7_014715 [Fusarium commune]